jgi:hypothetical protein
MNLYGLAQDKFTLTEHDFFSCENKLKRDLIWRAFYCHPRQKSYLLRKSSVRNTHWDNCGDYMVVDLYTNAVVVGKHFEYTLENVEAWFCEE